jgi:hypothetical protein
MPADLAALLAIAVANDRPEFRAALAGLAPYIARNFPDASAAEIERGLAVAIRLMISDILGAAA